MPFKSFEKFADEESLSQNSKAKPNMSYDAEFDLFSIFESKMPSSMTKVSHFQQQKSNKLKPPSCNDIHNLEMNFAKPRSRNRIVRDRMTLQTAFNKTADSSEKLDASTKAIPARKTYST